MFYEPPDDTDVCCCEQVTKLSPATGDSTHSLTISHYFIAFTMQQMTFSYQLISHPLLPLKAYIKRNPVL